ncbi:MAG: transposase [Phycisphaerales bacterium]|nr:transposase [Phycisphaerales bacterium]
MKYPPVWLTEDQRQLVEVSLPMLCERGGWTYRICAAGIDHVHLLCDAVLEVHGKQIRTWVKRWMTQALNERWPRHSGSKWWAEGGSTKPVEDVDYLNNVFHYIARQRVRKS